MRDGGMGDMTEILEIKGEGQRGMEGERERGDRGERGQEGGREGERERERERALCLLQHVFFLQDYNCAITYLAVGLHIFHKIVNQSHGEIEVFNPERMKKHQTF